MRRGLRPFIFLPFLGWVHCISYDPRLDASLVVTAPDEDPVITTCEPPPLSINGMRTAACPGGRCATSLVVRYWRDVWNDVDLKRTMTFREGSAGAWQLELTDALGNPAAWEFEVGRPVTLTVINPTGAIHDLTAPEWFRKVAWYEVVTTDASHHAPVFNAIELRAATNSDRQAVLRFVPIEAGTYAVWSAQGVEDGDLYVEIAAGTATPNLNTGDAAQGMQTTATVSGPALLAFAEGNPDRPASLDVDARRRDNHAVWQATTDVTVESNESLNEQTGVSVFTFLWSTTTLTRDVAYRLHFTNPSSNEREHSLTSPSLLRDAVVRSVEDAHVRLRLPYLQDSLVAQGSSVDLYLIPTLATTHTAYCRQGVSFGGAGHPDFSTGHPAAGMHNQVTVVP